MTRARLIAEATTVLVAVTALVVAIVALVTAPHAVSRAPLAPQTGIYADARVGQPHYFVVLSVAREGRVHGAMDYAYQDGQSSVVFTFVGRDVPTRPGSQQGALTLATTTVSSGTSASVGARDLPSTLSVLYGATTLSFGECTSYLHFVTSLDDCTFSRSPS